MLPSRIPVFATKLCYFRPQNHNRLLTISTIRNCTKKNTIVLDDDEPVKYSSSNAAKWKAEVSRSGVGEEAPWFQPYVISLSLSIFMIYFFYLREESDVDQEFDKNLYDRITGLEERQLELSLEYNSENQLPVDDIKRRLEEIRREKT